MSISPFCSVSFCFKYFEAPLLGSKIFRIMMSFWWVCSISRKYLSMSLVIFLDLKPIVLDINIASPVFLILVLSWYIFFNSFNLWVHIWRGSLVESMQLASLAFFNLAWWPLPLKYSDHLRLMLLSIWLNLN